jgi:hypothetical protein
MLEIHGNGPVGYPDIMQQHQQANDDDESFGFRDLFGDFPFCAEGNGDP